MKHGLFIAKLNPQPVSISSRDLFEITKAGSGGRKDLNFLLNLLDNGWLTRSEFALKRSMPDLNEEKIFEKYKKARFESDRHFLCRACLLEELEQLGVKAFSGMEVGDMSILRTSSSYDIVTEDYKVLIDVGLTPARNYFKGLTNPRVKYFLTSNFFDDYIEDIIFSAFSREDDTRFFEAVNAYQHGAREFSLTGK